MMTQTKTRNTKPLSLAAVAVSLGLAVTAATPAKAGLLEMIFGGPRPAPAPVSYAPIPDVGAPIKAQREAGPRKAEESKPRTQMPMDVSGDPEWYLRDPTLRKGDIIVLPTKVLVYNGGGRDKRDFAELNSSGMVSKKDRDQVLALTQAPRESLVSYRMTPVSPNYVATAGEDKTAGLDAPGTVDPAAALKKQ